MFLALSLSFLFFFNDTATTEIYTLSLHDALPIWIDGGAGAKGKQVLIVSAIEWNFVNRCVIDRTAIYPDRKSTRLNSSHQIISYAVFCLKKKKTMLALLAGSAARTNDTVHITRIS